MGWTGRGSCGGWTVKPILKEVELMSFQLISFHDAIPLLAACDCFHPIPNLLQVVFLQLLLHRQTFRLYSSLASFSLALSSLCTCLSSAWSPSLNALFFLLRRFLTLLVIQGLLLGKQRTVLVGTTISMQKFR